MPATPPTTTPSPADLRQRAAVAQGRERRRAELLPLRTEVAEAIEAVGWRRARPVVESVLGTVPVTGPHDAWWGKVGKRAGAAILAGLVALPEPQLPEPRWPVRCCCRTVIARTGRPFPGPNRNHPTGPCNSAQSRDRHHPACDLPIRQHRSGNPSARTTTGPHPRSARNPAATLQMTVRGTRFNRCRTCAGGKSDRR